MILKKNARGRNKTIETALVSLHLHPQSFILQCIVRDVLLDYSRLRLVILVAFLLSYNILSLQHGITSLML